MSQSLYDMMTPEQARMMLAAFRERLPTGGVADEALVAGGLPMDLLSSVAPAAPAEALPTPPIPPEGGAPTAPVVTDGAAAATSPTTPQAQADSLSRLRDLIGGGDRPSMKDRGRENLMNFFFSMAASRNPSFFGQLGEAGQQFARADAASRAEALQERRLDIEAGFRAAQEERQLRELQQYEDPNSLRGRYIQAQIDELNARRDRAGRDEGLGQGIPGELGGRQGIYYPRSDTFRPYAEGFQAARTVQQEDAAERRAAELRLRIDNEAERRLNSNPATQLLDGEARRVAKNAIVRELETALRRQPDQQQQGAPTGGPEIRDRPF